MKQVKRVPVAFLEEIDAVSAVFSKGQIGPFFDNKVLWRRLDHALIAFTGPGRRLCVVDSSKPP